MNKVNFPAFDTFRHFVPLKRYFLENRLGLATGLFCLLIVDFLQLVIPQIIKNAINSLTFKSATSSILLKYSITILIIAMIIGCLRFIWRLFLFGNARKIEERLRNRLFRHLASLSFSFYQRTKTGDLMAKAINDINYIRMATGMGLVAITDGLILGVAAIGFMISIDPLLTLISIIPAPMVIYFSRKFTHRMATGYDTVQKTFADLTERVREAFAGIRVVKAYQWESWEHQRVKEEGRKYVNENMDLAKTIALFFPMMALFTNLSLAIVIWLGGSLTIFGRITTGEFVAFIGYLNLLTWPMMAMGWVTNIYQRGSASMRRINNILDEKPGIVGPFDSQINTKMKGRIIFKDISFKYPNQAGYALRDISFTIETGQTVSLVGRVGSGKTTLLQMIPRLFDVTVGELFIDGKDIREYLLRNLRENIGFVTQDTIVFSDSIRNNVVFGRDHISDQELEAALKAAMIYEDIMNLKNGLDSNLGERGITLSGGQRQRLTIARALVANPSIMILDDSLSMVDTRTEEGILNNILKLRRGKTNLIVSHRHSTISKADLIVVLEHGKLVEIGDNETLLNKESLYTRLYQKHLLAQELEIGA